MDTTMECKIIFIAIGPESFKYFSMQICRVIMKILPQQKGEGVGESLKGSGHTITPGRCYSIYSSTIRIYFA